MISRFTKLQVLAFLVVSVLGVGYVGLRYVGLGDRFAGGTYVLYADLASAGGIFPNAPVTYRGVPVGRVAAVRLHDSGVRAELRLQRDIRVPVDLTAVVAQRSAVGEQYLDLRPNTDAGPYLRALDTIPSSRTGTPLPVETLLANLDALIRSVNPNDLSVVIDELGKAFEGNESALRRLLDASSVLLADANLYLPQTQALIRDGQTVLTTQAASGDAIRAWAAALAQFTATLRTSDPDLRALLANGPPAASQLIGLLHDIDPSIGTLLGNLITVDGIAVRRLNGIEQVLVVFPLIIAGGFTVAPGDGTAHLGLVVNLGDPPSCQYTQTGQPQRCTAAEQARGSSVRGANNAPGAGGPPVPASGAQPDPATDLVVGEDGQPLLFGGTGGQYRVAGEQSWKELLLAGLAP